MDKTFIVKLKIILMYYGLEHFNIIEAAPIKVPVLYDDNFRPTDKVFIAKHREDKDISIMAYAKPTKEDQNNGREGPKNYKYTCIANNHILCEGEDAYDIFSLLEGQYHSGKSLARGKCVETDVKKFTKLNTFIEQHDICEDALSAYSLMFAPIENLKALIKKKLKPE